ncbi:hypothetical protein FKG94_11385 [Exilibacterium tricleocarpae]|uniref:Flippase-like domain-containing protein n=1 Tax=Exilibacterium tricleocarpae TaxID=2591008 RepID=A0A545TQH1_9GAMM|nr:hypothetical protein [Exilibacterium tricleocarpae]TQV79464.1 hypothetical protein FKG94_11385 [Exilibacterium tricleocarpae]
MDAARLKTVLGILKRSIAFLIVVSVLGIALYQHEVLIDVLQSLGYAKALLLIVLWSCLALLSPYCTILALRSDLRAKLNGYYYDIAIRRLLARYIPGGFWMLVGKGVDLHEKGVPATSIKSILIYETVLPLVAAASISTFAILVLRGLSIPYIVALLLVSYLVFRWSFSLRLFRAALLKEINYGRGVVVTWVYWLALAGIFGFYYSAIENACVGHCISLASAYYVFSWAVGYAVPVAPQGLGVAEFMFSLLLDAESIEVIVAQLIGFRLVVLMGDTLAVGLRALFLLLRTQRHRLV